MGIAIITEDGLDKPVIFCDWCAERIREASKAICIWKIPGEPEPSLIVFLHKGACDRSYVAAHGGKQAWHASMELGTFPFYTGNNLGVDWPREVERGGFLSGF